MTWLLPNLGGEEGPGWRNLLAEPAVRGQARLWRLLFPASARLLYLDEALEHPPEDAGDRADLGPPPETAAFPWLETPEAPERIVAWVVTADALADRRVAGRPLAGPAPEVVARVHDKAFAHEVARAEGLVPPLLRGCVAVLAPEALRAPDAAERIDAILDGWPEWARARFTLKPRLGSSGRGRVAGEDGRLDPARLGGALGRLAEHGGAILEPWLERTCDLSVQLHVAGPGAEPGVTLLGSLEQCLTPAGGFLGHRGELDSRGRVFSGHAEEEALREAAACVAVAAREAGYMGPCGVDAFELRDPAGGGPRLRPVVELNARFTAGTVTVGLVRRALPRVKEALGLGPGERIAFRLWLDLAGAEREAVVARVAAAPASELLLGLGVSGPLRPALLFSRASGRAGGPP